MVVLIVLLLLGGLALFGALGWWVLFRTDSDQRKAESNADEILDAAFDGREDVVFTVNMRTVKYETVVLGAKKRGYRLVNESGEGAKTLIFEKV